MCHSPWHQQLTCQQYRQGDKLLKLWAKQLNQGQLNAQRCPKCKVIMRKMKNDKKIIELNKKKN